MLTTFQLWKNLIWDGEFVKWFNVTKLFALLLFEWLTLRTSVNSQGFAAFFFDSTLSRAELSQSWVLLYYLTLFRTRMFDFRKCGWTNHLTTLTGAGSSFFRSSLFATMSDSLSSLFKMSDHELIAISLFCWKKFVFFTCFWQFFTVFPFLCPRVNRSHPSLFRCSFLKCDRTLVALYKRVTMSKLLPSLFTKERLWAIQYRRSLQKSYGSNSLFSKSESLFCSFAHKKQVIR